MSEIKVNKISPRAACGTVTLGDSGDTFTIPAGATINNQGTATNFGATGSASWNTTVKTGDFTAVAGEGYFVNTTSGEIDVTLPASPSAGDVVAIKDYANTWDTNNCILLRNGSNIGGLALDSTISTEGLAVTLVFVDATKGWLVTDSGLQSEVPGPTFIVATGGTVTTSGNDKIHTFTGPGSFAVSCAGNSAGSNQVSYLVIGGGGATNRGGTGSSGGGGAGGYREGKAPFCAPFTASPLAAPGLTVTAQTYPIVIGGGGTGQPTPSPTNGTPGVASSFDTITSAGGGSSNCAGGSGGGGNSGQPSKAGNTPPVSPPQGNAGGSSTASNSPSGSYFSGGGGGAGAAGTAAANPPGGGPGGAGATSEINASPVQRAGGGGGAAGNEPSGSLFNAGTGGAGGGGNGGRKANGSVGSVNTGGGAGGAGYGCFVSYAGANGGSGIVIIRYKFQ